MFYNFQSTFWILQSATLSSPAFSFTFFLYIIFDNWVLYHKKYLYKVQFFLLGSFIRQCTCKKPVSINDDENEIDFFFVAFLRRDANVDDVTGIFDERWRDWRNRMSGGFWKEVQMRKTKVSILETRWIGKSQSRM